MGYWANLLGTLEPILRIGLNKAALDTSLITTPKTYQLPDTSGTLALVSQLGGGGGLLKGTSVIVCSPRSDMGRVTVAAPTVLATSVITPSIGSVSTADHNADEHLIERMSVRVTNIVPGVSFDLVLLAESVSGLSGSWNINWTLSA